MKELSIEQKEKAYDNLIERLKDLKFAYRFSPLSDTIDENFPELKEPEDERIRKAIIKHFKTGTEYVSFSGFSKGEIINWLEMQGEQNNHTLEQVAQIFLDALSNSPYNNKPITDAQTITKQLLNFLQNSASYNPDALVENEQKPNANCLLSWSEIEEKMLQSLESIVKDYWAKAEQEKNEIKIREASNVSYFLETIQKSPLCWIKCSDGLPTKDGIYLVVTDGRHNDAYDIARYDTIEGWHKASEVIYWMPIPRLNNKSIIKQQKPTEKVEPKFKVGDWIVKNDGKDCFSDGSYVLQITDIDDVWYKLSNGCYLIEPFTDTYRLWTIQDAKKGDVLVNGTILIIVDHLGTFEDRPIIYSWYFTDNQKFYGSGPTEPDRWEVKGFIPATKEQRELLFKNMKEAGYDWDTEKKELKKMEQGIQIEKLPSEMKTIGESLGFTNQEECDKYNQMVSELIMSDDNKGERGPGWSEEDEDYYDAIIAKLEVTQDDALLTDNQMKFLKSLKDRVQPKVELTKLDKNILEAAIAFVEQNNHFNCWCGVDKHTVLSALHSLRPQNIWRPSDEQIHALEDSIEFLGCTKKVRGDLKSLLKQLKKLRE